jgi:type VI secretion system protein VasI
MRRLLLAATTAAVCCMPLGAIADLKTDIAKCAASKPDSSRLACYDRLATDLKVDGPKVDAVTGAGKWRVRVETSPVDDSKNAFASLDAENSVQKRYDSATPSLLLRCKERKLEGYISYGKFFLGSDSTKVLTRFDKRPALTASWGISTDHSAVFVGGSVVNFVKELLKSESLLVELTPYSESPVLATFDVRGIKEASKSLQQVCPWK